MRLNFLKPSRGAKKSKTRVGRGIGGKKGKTCGRGHKGQHSRSGGYHKTGFEGGQMPIQRRIPKFGFISQKQLISAEVRLHELNRIPNGVVNIDTLKAANIIRHYVKYVKIFASGNIKNPLVIYGLRVSKGVKSAIEATGGRING